MGGAPAILTCIYSFAFMLYTLHSVSYILNILVITLQLRATSPRCYDGWEGMLLRSIMHLHYCRFYIIVAYNWKGDICWPELGNWSIWSGGVIISGIRCSCGQCQWTEEAGIGHRGQGNSYTDQYEIACEPSHHQRDKIHDYRLNDRMGGRGSQRCCSYSEPPCLASHLVRSTLLVKRPGQEEALMRGGYYRNCDQIASLSSEH